MLEKMKTENGYFQWNGKEYVLVQQAHLDGPNSNPYYRAMAVCTADTADEDGYQPSYEVRFEILDDYTPEDMSEDMACNWDKPENVREDGEYSITENRFA